MSKGLEKRIEELEKKYDEVMTIFADRLKQVEGEKSALIYLANTALTNESLITKYRILSNSYEEFMNKNWDGYSVETFNKFHADRVKRLYEENQKEKSSGSDIMGLDGKKM